MVFVAKVSIGYSYGGGRGNCQHNECVTTLDCDSCRKFGDGGNEKCSRGYEFGGDRGDYSDSGPVMNVVIEKSMVFTEEIIVITE
ncbi:hypothetical protein YC2023_022115 [Brassica napus]